VKSLFSAISLKLTFVLLLSGMLSACGFHFRSSYLVPEAINQISVTSYDRYSSLTRAVESQLRLNGIEMVAPAENVPNIHLISEALSSRTISLYQNSQAAEKELTYSASYRVTLPDVGEQSFTTTANRTYLSNPQAALAKSVEEDQHRQEMIEQAAQQIMRQMARLNNQLEQESSSVTADNPQAGQETGN
jgi:LPS-assembly lipoprotein